MESKFFSSPKHDWPRSFYLLPDDGQIVTGIVPSSVVSRRQPTDVKMSSSSSSTTSPPPVLCRSRSRCFNFQFDYEISPGIPPQENSVKNGDEENDGDDDDKVGDEEESVLRERRRRRRRRQRRRRRKQKRKKVHIRSGQTDDAISFIKECLMSWSDDSFSAKLSFSVGGCCNDDKKDFRLQRRPAVMVEPPSLTISEPYGSRYATIYSHRPYEILSGITTATTVEDASIVMDSMVEDLQLLISILVTIKMENISMVVDTPSLSLPTPTPEAQTPEVTAAAAAAAAVEANTTMTTTTTTKVRKFSFLSQPLLRILGQYLGNSKHLNRLKIECRQRQHGDYTLNGNENNNVNVNNNNNIICGNNDDEKWLLPLVPKYLVTAANTVSTSTTETEVSITAPSAAANDVLRMVTEIVRTSQTLRTLNVSGARLIPLLPMTTAASAETRTRTKTPTLTQTNDDEDLLTQEEIIIKQKEKERARDKTIRCTANDNTTSIICNSLYDAFRTSQVPLFTFGWTNCLSYDVLSSVLQGIVDNHQLYHQQKQQHSGVGKMGRISSRRPMISTLYSLDISNSTCDVKTSPRKGRRRRGGGGLKIMKLIQQLLEQSSAYIFSTTYSYTLPSTLCRLQYISLQNLRFDHTNTYDLTSDDNCAADAADGDGDDDDDEGNGNDHRHDGSDCLLDISPIGEALVNISHAISYRPQRYRSNNNGYSNTCDPIIRYLDISKNYIDDCGIETFVYGLMKKKKKQGRQQEQEQGQSSILPSLSSLSLSSSLSSSCLSAVFSGSKNMDFHNEYNDYDVFMVGTLMVHGPPRRHRRHRRRRHRHHGGDVYQRGTPAAIAAASSQVMPPPSGYDKNSCLTPHGWQVLFAGLGGGIGIGHRRADASAPTTVTTTTTTTTTSSMTTPATIYKNDYKNDDDDKADANYYRLHLLDVSGNAIPAIAFQSLADSLTVVKNSSSSTRCCYLRELRLCNLLRGDNITPNTPSPPSSLYGIENVFYSLRYNTSLHVVNLSRNSDGAGFTTNMINVLISSLQQNMTLHTLDLSSCGSDADNDISSTISDNGMNYGHGNGGGGGITEEMIIMLANGLPKMKGLQNLDLAFTLRKKEDNYVDDDDDSTSSTDENHDNDDSGEEGDEEIIVPPPQQRQRQDQQEEQQQEQQQQENNNVNEYDDDPSSTTTTTTTTRTTTSTTRTTTTTSTRSVAKAFYDGLQQNQSIKWLNIATGFESGSDSDDSDDSDDDSDDNSDDDDTKYKYDGFDDIQQKVQTLQSLNQYRTLFQVVQRQEQQEQQSRQSSSSSRSSTIGTGITPSPSSTSPSPSTPSLSVLPNIPKSLWPYILYHVRDDNPSVRYMLLSETILIPS